MTAAPGNHTSPSDRASQESVFRQCAELHVQALAGDFLAGFGPEFLSRTIYAAGSRSAYGKLFYEEDQGVVTGYNLFTYDFRKFIIDVFRQEWPVFLAAFPLRVLPRPRLFGQSFRVAAALCRDTEPPAVAGVHSEIMSIATNPRYRRRGIGRRLLAAMDVALRERGIAAVKARVLQDSRAAVAMYAHAGFETVTETVFLNRTWDIVLKKL